MATKIRQQTNSVALLQHIEQQAVQFSFLQIVRLLQRYSKTIGFKMNPSLAMPVAEIAALNITVDDSQQQQYQLLVNFLGLIGHDGIMPQHYKQLVLDRLQAKDDSLYEFLNIFHQHLLRLYYEILTAKRFYINYEKNHYDKSVAVLSGVVGQNVSRQPSLLHYAGLFAQQARSGQGLQQFISNYFQVPVTVYHYQPKWFLLPKSQQTKISYAKPNMNQLGATALLGKHAWQVQNQFTMTIGPLNLEQYQQYLPDGEYYQNLTQEIKNYVGLEHDFTVQLQLQNNQIPTCEIRYQKPLKLGWTTWISQIRSISQPGVSLC